MTLMDKHLGIPMLSTTDHNGLMAGRFLRQDTVWAANFSTILGRLTKKHGWHHEGMRRTDPIRISGLSPEHWVRAIIDSSVDPATLLGDAPLQTQPWRPYSIHRDSGQVALYRGRSRVVRSDGAVMWDGEIGSGRSSESDDASRRPRDLTVPTVHADWIAAPEWARKAVVDGLLAHAQNSQRIAGKSAARRDAARR